MKNLLFITIAMITAFTADAQTQKRKVNYTQGIVKNVNLSDMGSFPQGYETCVDIAGDGMIDQDYTWVTIEVETDEFIITCIAPSYMLPTIRKAGRLYTGCKVMIEYVVSGPRYGFPGQGFDAGPRTHAGEPLQQGAGAIKGKIMSIIG